jgi:hypothetical protein
MSSIISGRAGRRFAVVLACAGATSCLAFAGTASAAWKPGGQLLKLTHLGFNTNTSSNWFGYQQGTLEQGVKLFTSVTGNWTVPTATQHTSGQAENSADWIGIGGGCVDANCTVPDETLIQTGTEQDVAANGAASYDAWYEIIPAPELQITSMTIQPGDQMHASISQALPEVWKVTIQDLTRNESFTTTLPYPSTMDTAEWIEETPLEIGTNAGFAALPNLTDPAFNSLTVNGANPNLKTSEEIQLTDSSGNVIGTPSAPNSTGNGFSECTWTSTCP